MSIWIKVARFHLVNWILWVVTPWGGMAFAFAINLIASAAANHGGPNPTKSLAVFFAVYFVLGLLSISRSLPFSLALGTSRRSYYTGTALLAAALAVPYGGAITALQAIERATGGWGLHLLFFEVSYLFTGPWYLTWLTSFVALTLVFIYGMWFGIVFLRWGRLGLLLFIGVQAAVLFTVLSVAGSTRAWGRISTFFYTGPTATGLTGVFAALAVVLFAGGYAAVRRAAV